MNLQILFVYIILYFSKSFALRKLEDLMRVVGGVEIDNAELGGYIVAMRFNGFFLCGGSYVARRFVVTAAHCVEHFMEMAQALTIEGGITRLDEVAERVPVIKVAIPPTYTDASKDMDVAVLKLKRHLSNPNVKTIKLCSHVLQPGDPMAVSGWGLTHPNDKAVSNHLRTVIVPAVSKAKCRSVYRPHFRLTHSMICAGELGKKDACSSDSGGPMVHNKELCGIVSFGVSCAHKKFPGVYTDIHVVKAFITKSMKEL